MHEGTYRRKASITSPDCVVALTLQVVEEGQYQRCIQFDKVDLLGSLTQMALSKPQQQAKTVSVGGHRLFAYVPLLNQAIEEELLEKSRKATLWILGLHRVPPSTNCANRWAAIVISSGVAVRYQ